MRRRGCARLRARAAIDQLRHRRRGSPAATDFDESANDRPNHVAEKPVGGDLIHEHLTPIWNMRAAVGKWLSVASGAWHFRSANVRSEDGAHRAAHVGADTLERREVVGPGEHRCRRAHRGDVEALPQLPDEGPSEWVATWAGANLITVGLRSRAEPRMEIGGCLCDLEYPNVLGKLRVDARATVSMECVKLTAALATCPSA